MWRPTSYMFSTEPFWRSQTSRPADLPVTAALPERVDVAIVGSGYTGLNAARVLAKSGASVSVLERETIGWGASSRNGGMATSGLKRPLRAIVDNYGEEKARAFWQASLDAIDLVEELVTIEGIDCDWRRSGHVYLAYKRNHFDAMRKSAAWYRERFGHEVRIVSPSDLRDEIGSRVFHGGLVDDYSGGLQPAKYVYGLAAAVARRGVLLHEQTSVERVARDGDGFALHTSSGVLRAKDVLIATNGYTDRLVPALAPRVFPVGSYIIVTGRGAHREPDFVRGAKLHKRLRCPHALLESMGATVTPIRRRRNNLRRARYQRCC